MSPSRSAGDVLKDVSFDIADGEVFFIIGASGVGKSVLIKHLVGLLRPDSGEILLDGEEVSAEREADVPRPQEVRDGVSALDAVRLHDLRRERRTPAPQAPRARA